MPERITLVSHRVVDSTNSVAKSLASDGAPTWTVVQALEQHAGRGRHGREWVSPPGNLYTSAILRPTLGLEAWPQMSFVVALAVATVAEQAAPGSTIRLKWPNDVLGDGAKLSGILLETIPAAGRDAAMIVGVGINVAHGPTETRYGATCLNRLAGEPVALDWVLVAYLRALVAWHDVWVRYGFTRIRQAWLDRAHGLGQAVEIIRPGDGLLRGRFTGLSEDGRMIVERPDGVVELVVAGTLNFTNRASE